MEQVEGTTATLRDGRRLGYAEYGDLRGTPAFYFHGTPGSRLEAGLLADAARVHGVRLIGVDRPGFGLSDFKKQRQILDWPSDVIELADALGIDRFAVVGLSGGGPHVAACARSLGSRLTAAAIVSGAGPVEARMTPDMGWLRRALFRFWLRTVPVFTPLFVWQMMLSVRHMPASRWPRFIDPRVLSRPEMRVAFKRDLVDAFQHGSRGAAHEYALFAKPWRFSLSEIAMPVRLWHGDADLIVPIAIGRFVAAAIPNCDATYFAGEGHLLFVDHTSEITAALR